MSGIIKTIKAKDDNNIEQNIFPKTVLEAVVDSVSGKTLDILMNEFVPEGTTYVDKEESEEIDTNVDKITLAKYVNYDNTESKLEANTVQEALDTVSSITKGKNRARVFNTTEDMNAWLSDEDNKGKAIVGDNLYIVALDVPDWWISEVLEELDSETGFYYKIAQLETQKVDLTTIESGISNIENKLSTKTGSIIWESADYQPDVLVASIRQNGNIVHLYINGGYSTGTKDFSGNNFKMATIQGVDYPPYLVRSYCMTTSGEGYNAAGASLGIASIAEDGSLYLSGIATTRNIMIHITYIV